MGMSDLSSFESMGYIYTIYIAQIQGLIGFISSRHLSHLLIHYLGTTPHSRLQYLLGRISWSRFLGL